MLMFFRKHTYVSHSIIQYLFYLRYFLTKYSLGTVRRLYMVIFQKIIFTILHHPIVKYRTSIEQTRLRYRSETSCYDEMMQNT